MDICFCYCGDFYPWTKSKITFVNMSIRQNCCLKCMLILLRLELRFESLVGLWAPTRLEKEASDKVWPVIGSCSVPIARREIDFLRNSRACWRQNDAHTKLWKKSVILQLLFSVFLFLTRNSTNICSVSVPKACLYGTEKLISVRGTLMCGSNASFAQLTVTLPDLFPLWLFIFTITCQWFKKCTPHASGSHRLLSQIRVLTVQ